MTDYQKRRAEQKRQEALGELNANTLKSYADKRGAQVAAMQADDPNPAPGSKEWIQQAVPAQQVNLAKRKIARKERQAGVAEDSWHGQGNTVAGEQPGQWTSEHDQWTREDAQIGPDSTSPVGGNVQEERLNVGDPVVVTAPNEFEGKTGEISEFSPSGKFVIVNLYNYGEHSMHLSDVEYNQYADDMDEVDEDTSTSPVTNAITRRILQQRLDLLKQYGPELVGAAVDNVADYVGDVEEIGSSDVSAWVAQVERMLKENPPEAFAEGFQDFNKVEPYEVCLAGKPVKTFDYYEDARRFHDNWKKKLYAQGEKAKADKITLNPIMKEAAKVDPNAPFDYDAWSKSGKKPRQPGKAVKQLAQQTRDAQKKKEQGVAEMDKSQKGAAGWNIDDYDYSKGKWSRGKIMTAKDAVKSAAKDLAAAFNQADKKKPKPVKESYWTRLQNERSTKLNSLVNELKESITK
jgi:hypothetical protein